MGRAHDLVTFEVHGPSFAKAASEAWQAVMRWWVSLSASVRMDGQNQGTAGTP